MATPTFNSIDLTTDAERNTIGSSQVRAYIETMPGVNGVFAQAHGTGGRAISVSGLIKVTGKATAADAVADVMTLFATGEALVDGSTVATFVSTDGTSYNYCLMQSYTHGPVQVSSEGATYRAYLPVLAQLVQLQP